MNTMSVATKPERADAIANRARILAAAHTIFARRGLEAEVREIAEEAGVGIGTLYRHFANREDLLIALLQRMTVEALERLRAAVAIADPRDAIRAVIEASAETHLTCGALVDIMHDKRMVERCDKEHAIEEVAALIAGLLSRGVATGAFRANLDLPVTTAFIMSIGVFSLQRNERSPDAMAAIVADLILAAIEAR